MILGIVGFIGSGKGTVASRVVDVYDYVEDSFAASLKDALCAIFGWQRDMIEGKTAESRQWRDKVDTFWAERLGKPDFTPRKAMQWFGTDACRRTFGEAIWVSTVENRFLNRREKRVIISDVRFKDEFNLIQKLGGKVIWVKRKDMPTWYDDALDMQTRIPHLPEPEKVANLIAAFKAKHDNIHESEWDWIGCTPDAVIDNDGTIFDLNEKVDVFMQSYLASHK